MTAALRLGGKAVRPCPTQRELIAARAPAMVYCDFDGKSVNDLPLTLILCPMMPDGLVGVPVGITLPANPEDDFIPCDWRDVGLPLRRHVCPPVLETGARRVPVAPNTWGKLRTC